MSEVEDAELLERARRGDEVAFSQLFARHQRAIYRYAVYLCGADAGDDIVQETFLAVLRQRGRHDAPRSTVVGYLIGIARHVVQKRFAARKDVSLDESLEDDLSETPGAEQTTVFDDLARAETIQAVRAAVYSLPARYREVVVLCELQEMDYDAAAAIIQCPIGTVRSRLSRARSLLTAKLAVGSGLESETFSRLRGQAPKREKVSLSRPDPGK